VLTRPLTRRHRAGDLQVSEFPVSEPGVSVGPVLVSEHRALLVPAGHPLSRQESVSLEDLADVPLIMPGGDVPKTLLDTHLPTRTPTGRPIPRGPSYTYWSEVPALVAAGLGASTVATRAARYHDRPGVTFRDGPRGERPDRDTGGRITAALELTNNGRRGTFGRRQALITIRGQPTCPVLQIGSTPSRPGELRGRHIARRAPPFRR
jgi:DNA-binding transcriptional LysR family regulator